MNPDDVQPSGQPPRWPNQPTNEPQQPNRYAWQQHLGQQDPDAQIIPNPGNVAQQPFEHWPATAPPEPPLQPLPELPPEPQPQPQLQPLPEPQPVQPQPVLPPEPPMQPPMRKRGRKKWVILLVLLVLAAGALYWFVLKPSGNEPKKQSDTTAKTNKPSAISDAAEESSAAVSDTATELGTLQSAKLNAPGNMDGYDVLTQSETFARYLSKTGQKCELGFGTLSAEELAGTDLDTIVAAQLKNIRDSGATVSGPAAGTALTLGDSADSSKKYSITTLKFELSKDDLRVKSRYSAAVLKDGRRAVVNRTCYTEDGTTVDEASMEALDATAKQITVTAG